MPRIRTIKPEFFRHEGLQDLAAKDGAHVMLVFAGLWGHCDRLGRFEWRPRQLKLDILPFLDFDMGAALEALAGAGFIERYEVDGKSYGVIPSFADHQRFSGKEAQEKEKHPAPPVKREGSTGEAPGKHVPAQEGSTRNGIREGKGERASALHSPTASPSSKPNRQPVERKPWPSEAVVPEPWLERAEGERRRLGLGPVDLAVVAAKFQAHYLAEGNARTQTEWEGKWLKFVLDEKAQKPNGSAGQHGAVSLATKVFGGGYAEARAERERGGS